MSWRTVIIEGRCKLDYRMGYMVVRSTEVKRVFLEEIAVLVIENPAVSLTGCLLEELINRKVRVIFCDSKRNPVSELTPHHGCHDSTARIKMQIEAFDRQRLFFTLNMHCFVTDEEMERFAHTAVSHGYHTIGIESNAHPLLSMEKRLIIDSDLCEIG